MTIWVWITTATSLPSSRRTLVCQTDERFPTCSGTDSASMIESSLAAPMKLVLLSIVVVAEPAGRLRNAPTDAVMSANAMMAPPCKTEPERQSAFRACSLARTRVGVASTSSAPISLGNG